MRKKYEETKKSHQKDFVTKLNEEISSENTDRSNLLESERSLKRLRIHDDPLPVIQSAREGPNTPHPPRNPPKPYEQLLSPQPSARKATTPKKSAIPIKRAAP